MIKMGRIVDTLGPAGNGVFGAQRVKVSLQSPPVEITAFAKPLDTIPFLVEILCALLAKELDIPCPDPIVAFSEDGQKVYFGSMLVDYPDLSQQVTIEHNQLANTSTNIAILRALSEWSPVDTAISFDEWIANEDRNLGNILYDGVNKFVLIDHNIAMRPHFSVNSPLDNNTLLGVRLAYNNDEVSKQRIKSTLQHIIQRLDATLPERITAQIRSDLGLQDNKELDKMRDFLTQRLTVLGKITCGKVPVKQLSL